MALSAGIPFIYVSANSGARLGLAEDLKLQFKVAWEDADAPQKVRAISANTVNLPRRPHTFSGRYSSTLPHFSLTLMDITFINIISYLQGFKYLYLTTNDFKKVKHNVTALITRKKL